MCTFMLGFDVKFLSAYYTTLYQLVSPPLRIFYLLFIELLLILRQILSLVLCFPAPRLPI